jgi:hypothetical protein
MRTNAFVHRVSTTPIQSNYLVLYAKQEALFGSGIADVISIQMDKKRKVLVKLFKVHFITYALGAVVVVPLRTVTTIVLTQTATYQGIRVV